VSRRRRVSTLCVVFIVSLVVVGVAGCTESGEMPKDAMAVVGDHVITKAEFDTRFAEIEQQNAGQVPTSDNAEAYKEFQVSVLNYLVELDVVRQEAAKMNITVTDEEVQEQIDAFKQWYGNDDATFEEALKQQNYTLESFKTALTEQIIASKVFSEVTKDATTTAEQIQAFYDAQTDAFTVPETRLVRQIVFMPKNSQDPSATSTEADWATALARAEQVRKEIANGADFGEMAKQYSDDEATKDLGGELGEVTKGDGQLTTELEDVVFSLKEFEVPEPVKTQYGYFLVQVTDITEERVQTLDEVRDSVEQNVLQAEQKKIWDAWLEKAKQELGVKYKAGFEPTTTTSTTSTTSVTQTAPTTPTTAKQ